MRTYSAIAQLKTAKGDKAGAIAAIEKVLELDPDFTIEGVAKSTIAFKHEEDASHCFEAMRKAGLSDR